MSDMGPTLAQPQGGHTVSIVMPVLNGLTWIPAAIASVLDQEVADVELIVLDGGSTDGTREWLERQAPGKVRVVLGRDRGQGDAIAKGLEMAQGPILGWLNADDMLQPGALGTVVAAFAEHPDAALVSGACWVIDGQDRVMGRIDPPPDGSLRGLLSHARNLAQPATFFSAAAYRRTAGIDTRLRYAMDVDLWLKLSRVGEVVLLPDQVLASFRIHAASKSAQEDPTQVREDLKVRLRQGMPLLSSASLTLMRWAYLRPIARSLRRLLRRPGVGR